MTILFRPQGAFGWFSYTTSRDTIALPKLVDFKVGVWIAMHQDLRRVRRIALVFDALAQSLSRFLEASE